MTEAATRFLNIENGPLAEGLQLLTTFPLPTAQTVATQALPVDPDADFVDQLTQETEEKGD